jgi:hypothetical protein
MSSANLAKGLNILGIPQYYDQFVQQGVDSLGKLFQLTQDGAKPLQIRAEHREIIHRIASILRLLADDGSASLSLLGFGNVASPAPLDGAYDLGKGGKRKYKRHPKPDPNAPQPPNSAYVVFSNEYRDKYVEDQTAFTEIAKAVGKAWREMDERERSRREKEASVLKQEYRERLRRYKDTEEYAEYKKYLDSFRAEELGGRTKQANIGFGRDPAPGRWDSSSATDLASKTHTPSPVDGTLGLHSLGQMGQSTKHMVNYVLEDLVRLSVTHGAAWKLTLSQ